MSSEQRDETIHTPNGDVQAIWQRPAGATAAFVLAHGAGAGMRHKFMEAMAARLAARLIATLRYEFLYMSAGNGRPDREPVLLDTIRAAVDHAHTIAPDLPLIAGGKSMGGRMTSRAAAVAPMDVKGIAFIGFPLHPPKKISIDRADHLYNVKLPMLFLQGTRDDLADLEQMRSVTDGIGSRATLYVVDSADHSFHVLKRSGRDDEEVLDDLADQIAAFAASVSRQQG